MNVAFDLGFGSVDGYQRAYEIMRESVNNKVKRICKK